MFDDANPTMSLSEIVAHTRLPKTTVHRAVEKMIELGWLRRERDRYSIGTRLFEVTSSSPPRATLHEVTRPHLDGLRAATHQIVQLTVLDGVNAVHVEQPARAGRRSSLPVGDRMPAHCTAAGKALLAFGPGAALDLVLRSGLPARTPATITAADPLHAELARIRAEGVAYDREEYEVGVACVAAPVRGPEGDCVAAISITGGASALQLGPLAAAVRATAQEASRSLGASPASGPVRSRSTDPGRRAGPGARAGARSSSRR